MKNILKLILFPVALVPVLFLAFITVFVALFASLYGDWGFKQEWKFWKEVNLGHLKAIIPFYES
jgi:hypothetical protein